MRCTKLGLRFNRKFPINCFIRSFILHEPQPLAFHCHSGFEADAPIAQNQLELPRNWASKEINAQEA
jgi:hypothetical protein